MSNERYWLFDWFDEFAIKSREDAARALDDASIVKRLLDQAAKAGPSLTNRVSQPNSVFAGVRIDLTSNLGCMHPDCRRLDVDRLFMKAWHYFDKIVVADEVTHTIAAHWDKASQQWRDEKFFPLLQVLLYVRDLGAEDLLEFRSKWPNDSRFRVPVSAKVLADETSERQGRLAAILATEASISDLKIEKDVAVFSVTHGLPATEASISDLKIEEDVAVFSLTHALLGHVQFIRIEVSRLNGLSDAQARRLISDRLIQDLSRFLAADLEGARLANAPLGAVNEVHRELLLPDASPTAAHAAFELELPFLEGISVGDLLELRRDNTGDFDRFRDSLRLALKQIKNENPEIGARDLAREVREDVIEPEIRRIRTALRKAQAALFQKSRDGVAVGGILTTCGLLSGFLPATAVGLATMAGAVVLPTYQRYDRQEEIEMSDMFFLWRAIEHAPEKVP